MTALDGDSVTSKILEEDGAIAFGRGRWPRSPLSVTSQ
jgi:hypothetical protein